MASADPLAQVVQFLSGTSDEEKFVGVSLVPRVLGDPPRSLFDEQSVNNQDSESNTNSVENEVGRWRVNIRRVFDAVGLPFLKRMLTSQDSGLCSCEQQFQLQTLVAQTDL